MSDLAVVASRVYSALFVYVSVSLSIKGQLRGTPHPGERHPQVNSAYVNLIPCLCISELTVFVPCLCMSVESYLIFVSP